MLDAPTITGMMVINTEARTEAASGPEFAANPPSGLAAGGGSSGVVQGLNVGEIVAKRPRGRPKKAPTPVPTIIQADPENSGAEPVETVTPIHPPTVEESLLSTLPAAWRDLLLNGTPDDLQKLATKIAAAERAKKLELFTPFPKQVEFIEAGASNRIRLLLAGNRAGKSETASYEMAMHLTGRYDLAPGGWKGKRFDKPINAWVAGVSAQATRNILQDKLIGPPSRRAEWGTGFIPKDCLDLDSISMLSGVPNAIDTINVRHVSGEWSTLSFMAFAQGREKFQGTAIDLALLDEECPIDVYSEVLTRLATTRGILMMTFTPLTGITSLVQTFLNAQTCPGAVIRATIHDNLALTKEDIEEIMRGWPVHERAARELGAPFMGSGAIFTTPEDIIKIEPFQIPDFWKVVCGLDLGFDHPMAAVKCVYDPDSDVIYLTHCHRVKGQTPLQHSETLKGWGEGIPFIYPHDALQHDRGSGETFSKMYARHGLNMVARATFEDGSNSVERGIQEMAERFMSSRLRVFSNCLDFFEEYRTYHRRDGKIVKMSDDVLSALRYAIMGLRYAAVPSNTWTKWSSGKPMKRRIKGVV